MTTDTRSKAQITQLGNRDADGQFRTVLAAEPQSALPGMESIHVGDDERECENCGETVSTLSSRDWCDGCEEEDYQSA